MLLSVPATFICRAQAESDDAFTFLEHLARNRSVKTLAVSYAMLSAGGGAALAHVLANHVALEALEVSKAREYHVCCS